jgi:deazaflavin-dependent oxidoreductase (nitroreductase family)
VPIPQAVARFNRKVTNRVTKPFAHRLGGFGVVHHIGRRSGKPYETPINCWVGDGVLTAPLTYGSEVDWLRNLTAAGGGSVVVKGQTLGLGVPRILDEEEGRARMPAPVRPMLSLLNVDEFVEFPILAS